MKISSMAVERIRPYEGNPRVNDQAVDALAAVIREVGFRVPIIVDGDGVIVAGHTRLKAALKLGMKTVPVHIASDLSPDQVRALRLADNRMHELSGWDKALLQVELDSLKAAEFDLSLLGWSEADLSALMAPAGSTGLVDPDEVPIPPKIASTAPGDLWTLGGHRLLCGDSARAADLDRLLGGERVHLVHTDPPYNVTVEPRSNNALAHGGKGLPHPDQKRRIKSGEIQKSEVRAKDRRLENDTMTVERYREVLLAWFKNAARALEPGCSFYFWGGYANCANYPAALEASGLYFSQSIIWDKQWPLLTRKDFMGAHEWCFYGWKEGAAHRFFGPPNVPDIWPVKKVTPQAMIHLTEKPVELARRACDYSSRPGEAVLDLFGGSGSTLIACEMTGRRAFVMELDALYCDVIVDRWERFTGKKAERIPIDASGPAPARKTKKKTPRKSGR